MVWVPLAESLDHAGPLARTVDDAAILFDAIRGEYPRPAARPKAFALKGRHLRIKLGLPANYFFDLVDPEVQAAIEAAVKLFEAMGARTDEVPLPHLEESVDASTKVGLAEATSYHASRGDFPARAADYSEDVQRRLKLGLEITVMEYLAANEVRRMLTADFDRAFERVDAIVVPATTITAPRIGETKIAIRGEKVPLRNAVVNANRPANFTGHPAIALPCGFSKSGLPIGLQLIGPRWQETKLLAIARAYEQATEWHTRHPSL